MSLDKIRDIINKHKSFLILTHVNPDGDALGSQIALARILRRRGKKVFMFAEERPPHMYRFLPGIDKIKTNYRSFKKKTDVVIVLDCAKTSRVGKVQDLISNQLVINIDHHPAKREETSVVLRNTYVAATSVLIYKLFRKMKVKIDKETALLLYLGIVTDTGSFRYSNTSSQTYRIASDLVKLGARPNYVNKQLYEAESLKKLRLLGLCLETLKLYDYGKICTMKATNKMYERTSSGPEYTEDFVNFPRKIKGVSVAIFFRENKENNIIKVSFRSKEKINVDKIARIFDGGGHPQASGCKLEGNIEEVEKKILKTVREFTK